jgi:hypothetical protein
MPWNPEGHAALQTECLVPPFAGEFHDHPGYSAHVNYHQIEMGSAAGVGFEAKYLQLAEDFDGYEINLHHFVLAQAGCFEKTWDAGPLVHCSERADPTAMAVHWIAHILEAFELVILYMLILDQGTYLEYLLLETGLVDRYWQAQTVRHVYAIAHSLLEDFELVTLRMLILGQGTLLGSYAGGWAVCPLLKP